jgi:chromosomal replication initiator protein
MDNYAESWLIVKKSLEEKYSQEIMNLWFNKLRLVYLDDKYAFFTVSSADYLISILNSKYTSVIEEIFSEKIGLDIKAKVYKTETYSEEKAKAEFAMNEEKKNKSAAEINTYNSFTEEYTFENFVVGGSNSFAYNASLAVANNPAAEYNPLLIYGDSGLGKTHLMKAIISKIKREKPYLNVLFITGENFTNEFLDALAKKETSAFKEKYRNIDMLMIDDIQFIAGREATQEEFFHTFNTLYELKKQIVLTSDRPPKEMKNLEDRIKSRFEGGLIVDIQPPDTELRIAILKSKCNSMNIRLSNEVLVFIAENVKTNIRQIEGALKKLGAYSFVNNVDIDVEKAKKLLEEFISNSMTPQQTAEKIIDAVSARFNIKKDEIKGKSRAKEIAWARHVSIYLIRNITDLSLQTIGKIFGRDHSTVLSSIEVVNKEIMDNPISENDIKELMREFK